MMQTQQVKTSRPSRFVSSVYSLQPTHYNLRWQLWLLVPALALVLVGCSGKKDETPPNTTETETTQPSDSTAPTTGDPTSLTEVAPSSLNTKVTTNLNLATNAAHDWRADAVLTYASVELPASLKIDSGNEVYVFGSAADTENWWTYSISQTTNKFVRALIPREDYLGGRLDPVNIEYWNMNYAEALQLAEKNGGSDFRLANSGARVATFLSQRAPRGWLWWTVEYTAPSGEQFTLLINPNRGEVVNESGDEVAPPGADNSVPADTTSSTSSEL